MVVKTEIWHRTEIVRAIGKEVKRYGIKLKIEKRRRSRILKNNKEKDKKKGKKVIEKEVEEAEKRLKAEKTERKNLRKIQLAVE